MTKRNETGCALFVIALLISLCTATVHVRLSKMETLMRNAYGVCMSIKYPGYEAGHKTY
uniref:Uncharacterized protein n=1 Tax=viral metagenome TaxID=1070528 RepID=A0A6M3L4V4_9ZZZZ